MKENNGIFGSENKGIYIWRRIKGNMQENKGIYILMRIKGCMEENKGIYGRIKGIFGSENIGIYAGPDTGGVKGSKKSIF